MTWYCLVNYNKHNTVIWSILHNLNSGGIGDWEYLYKHWRSHCKGQYVRLFVAVINTPDNNLMRRFTAKMVEFISGSLVLGKVMAKGYCEDNSQDTGRKERGTNVFFQSHLWSTFSSQASHFSPPLNNAIKVWVHQWIDHWPGQSPHAQSLPQGLSADKQALTHALLLVIVSNWQCSKAITTLWQWESDFIERGWPDAPLSLPVLHNSCLLSSLCLCLKSMWQRV